MVMKNKKLFWGILTICLLAIIGIGSFVYLKKPAPQPYYGQSTYGFCENDDDCFISGCNSEICQSKSEEILHSICIVPEKPTPKQLGYECKCLHLKCQWSKPALRSRTISTPTPSLKTTSALLELNPDNLTFYQAEGLKVDILVESEAEILGADLFLKYDPDILAIKRIVPGKFFSSPLEIQKRIKESEGETFYALGTLTPKRGRGIIASFIFQPQKNLVLPQTIEIVLTSQTELAAKGIDLIKLKLPVLGKYTILE